MRWTLVALVVSCAHHEAPNPVSRAVPVAIEASVEEASSDAEVPDAAPPREDWRARVEALVFPNVEHAVLAPLVAGNQVPVVRVGDVRTTEGFEPVVARRIVRRNMMLARYCYERALRSDPNLDKLTVTFRVAALHGDIVYAGVTKTNAPSELAACVANAYGHTGMPDLGGGLTAYEATVYLDQPPSH